MTDRLFFALWPDDELRRALIERLPGLLAGVGGRPRRPDQWHVTLEFLGDVAPDRQAAVRTAADAVEAGPLTVQFDSLDHWRRPQVLCLSATATPPALTGLVTELRAALFAQGFVPETRPFLPHVTLARKVPHARPAPLASPLAWSADRFALVRSTNDSAGSRYEPLCWWNLRGGTG